MTVAWDRSNRGDVIASCIAERTGRKAEPGRMNWHADSCHIYGKDIGTARKMLFDRADRFPFQDRMFNFHDEMIQEIF